MRTQLLLLGVLCGVGACRASLEPDGGESPWLVSNPIQEPAASSAAAPAAGSLNGRVAFVSLPRGSIANGVAAGITNRRAGASTVATLQDGGLDPTAIPAEAGDTLDLVVSVSNGAPLQFSALVPLRARPIVVRTEPPPHKRDVPLNAYLIIVFSEPIDAAALDGGAITLRSGTTTVAGQLGFADSVHSSLAFIPAAPLAPLTEYELVVTSQIHDLSGEAIATEVIVPFRTAAASSDGTLRIIVSTEGAARDPDGYVVAVAGQQVQSIGTNGELGIDLPPGVYTVYLAGLASNCLVVGPQTVHASIQTGVITQLSFRVACPLVTPGSLLISVVTQFNGTGWPSTFGLSVDGGPAVSIAPTGYLVVGPLVPGGHSVTLVTPYGGGSFCLVDTWPPPPNGLNTRSVTVRADEVTRVSYNVTCIP
jgi:hypothetical protein